MDTQTLVNRIEELRNLSDSTLNAIKGMQPTKRGMIKHLEGEKMAFDMLLIWLKENGVTPDTI